MRRVGILFGLTLSLLVPAGGREAGRAAEVPPPPAPSRLVFQENRGQGPRGVEFVARHGSGSWSFDRHGFAVTDGRDTIRMTFAGSGASALRGEAARPGRLSYLLGPDPVRRARIFDSVRYPGLYPGIDALFHSRDGAPEYDFQVRPGADPQKIRLVFDRRTALSVARDGSLVARSGGLLLSQARPVAYQVRDGRRARVTAWYETEGAAATIGVGTYDPSLPLVIDPVIAFSTFLGGDGADWATGIAVDGRGSVYVTGFTQGPGFPTTKGAFQRTFKPDHDAFVTKFSRSGKLVYSTLLGGSPNHLDAGGDDSSSEVAVHDGHALIAGTTTSDDFPVKNAFQSELRGGGTGAHTQDAFVAKLSRDGSSLVYSTFLGGAQNDSGTTIGVAPDGSAWVGGTTYSPDFPTVDAFQATYAGNSRSDGFLTRVDPSGRTLGYSTYLGGSGDETIWDLALHGGRVYVTGTAYTSDYDLEEHRHFPTTRGAFQTKAVDNQTDTFVAKFGRDPSRLDYSTYVGGRGRRAHLHDENGGGIAVDSRGRAVVTGATESRAFPLKRPWQRHHHDVQLKETFVTKLNGRGSGLVFSTLFGAGGHDNGYDVALDRKGNAHVVGRTSAHTLPQRWSFQPLLHDYYDGFVATFSRAGRLRFSTYVGGVKPWDGAAEDEALVAVAAKGRAVYVAGYTQGDYPLVSASQKKRFGQDGVVTRLRPLGRAPLHRTRVTVRLRHKDDYLRLKGRLRTAGGFDACSRGRRVVVEEKNDAGWWYPSGASATGRRGRYRLSTWDTPSRRFRVSADSVVKKVGGRWHRCSAVTSAARLHRH
ncbi:MAG TPA: SBBP repeat-containing protein [Actinomycetota bacterium]|nr:SBBP repeat-containing protein [Actinomycetota bacterium]